MGQHGRECICHAQHHREPTQDVGNTNGPHSRGVRLTAHLATGQTNQEYERFINYLRRYGVRTDVQKLRAMVAKRPIGDKIPTEHLHALRIEFGTKPETLSFLRRILVDSLAPHIAALLASEKLMT